MDQPKYHIDIFWSDEDDGYIANVPALRYCSAFGESYEEALREVLVAMELHLDTLRELSRPIPKPGARRGVGVSASEQATDVTGQKAATGKGSGLFNSSKTVPYVVDDLTPVAQEVMRYFESQDYEATETNLPAGGVQVSIRRGGTFKAIIGMKTALNIKIEPVEGGTQVDAGVGIFGQQAIPTMITALVFWPVIIAQVWNMAQEAKLDEEALDVAEESLKAHASGAPSPISEV
jgi:predicted RNase H-like HicB family nuclease